MHPGWRGSWLERLLGGGPVDWRLVRIVLRAFLLLPLLAGAGVLYATHHTGIAVGMLVAAGVVFLVTEESNKGGG
jgi:hypothetical protein